MSLLPDPHVLRAIATCIGRQAEATRTRAHALDTALGGVTWQGQAAHAFRTVATPLSAGLRASAHDLDRAAAALRSHADAVDAVLGDLRRGGVDLVHSGSDVLSLLRDGAEPGTLLAHPGILVHDGTHLAHDGVHLARDGGRLGVDFVHDAVGGARHGARALASAVGL